MSSSTKGLGFGALLALGVNGIVGVGIFFTPSAIAALLPGGAGTLAYLLTTLALVPVASVYALLGSRFEEDGGPYVWARAAFGPAAGFFVGWGTYVSSVFALSAVIVGLSQYLGPTLGFDSLQEKFAFSWLCVGVLGGIVALGLRLSAWAWSALTVAKLVPLVLLVILYVLSSTPQVAAEAPPWAWGNLGRAMLTAVFALQGFEIVPVVAGSASGARLNVPRATLASLLLAASLYVVLQLACVEALPDLAHTEAPLLAAAGVLGGDGSKSLVGAGANVSALGIAFGMVAMTPRYLATLGRPDALGPWLGHESARKVPLRALAITTTLVLILISIGKFAGLLVLASLAVLVQYGVSAASLAKLALERRCGFERRHLWPAPLALGAILLIAQAAKLSELWVLTGVLVAGAVLLRLRLWLGARLPRTPDLS